MPKKITVTEEYSEEALRNKLGHLEHRKKRMKKTTEQLDKEIKKLKTLLS